MDSNKKEEEDSLARTDAARLTHSFAERFLFRGRIKLIVRQPSAEPTGRPYGNSKSNRRRWVSAISKPFVNCSHEPSPASSITLFY
jgi:hypothetical protein